MGSGQLACVRDCCRPAPPLQWELPFVANDAASDAENEDGDEAAPPDGVRRFWVDFHHFYLF